MPTKILVTGAAGFIGYHLCEKLLQNENNIIVGLDNLNDYYDINLKLARLEQLGIESRGAVTYNSQAYSKTHNNKFAFLKLDLQDRENLFKLFRSQDFDIVIHMAAQAGVRYSLENPHLYADSNIIGFLNILESCRNYSIKHFVYASSSSVYGANKKAPFAVSDKVDQPISLYAATKKSNELMAYTYSHLYQIPTTGLRFFTVYGPWARPDMALSLFTKAIIEGKNIDVFNEGKMSRDFTYVDDVIKAIELILNSPPSQEENIPPNRIFNVGTGKPQSLLKFISAIEHELEREAKKNFLPLQPGDVPKTWADTTNLRKMGFKTTTEIEEGVSKFISWYKGFYNI